MPKFVLASNSDGNDKTDLEAKTYKEALEEGLEALGYSILEG